MGGDERGVKNGEGCFSTHVSVIQAHRCSGAAICHMLPLSHVSIEIPTCYRLTCCHLALTPVSSIVYAYADLAVTQFACLQMSSDNPSKWL